MVSKINVPMFQAADGKRFATERAAQVHEWRSQPVDVPAHSATFLGITHDLRGSRWRWQCGRCHEQSRQVLDTMLRYYSATCEHCLAGNHFDFHKYEDQMCANG